MSFDLEPHVAQLLTRSSVRLAIACYLGRVSLEIGLLGRSQSTSTNRLARWLWTIACTFYLAHVFCAFEFYHHWEHGRALEHTAAQTEALTGIRWGGGLYFNYAFTLFWLADVIAWWVRGASAHYRVRGYLWTVHGVFVFMAFNATVVFGPPGWRLVAPIVAIAIVIAFLASRRARTRMRS